MQEGVARVGASDGAALPAIVGPPVEPSPAHQRSAQVGRRRLDLEACRRDPPPGRVGGGASVGGGAPGGGGSDRKAAMVSSQLVRLSSGSHVLPAASKPVQRTSTYRDSRPYRTLNLTSCTLASCSESGTPSVAAPISLSSSSFRVCSLTWSLRLPLRLAGSRTGHFNLMAAVKFTSNFGRPSSRDSKGRRCGHGHTKMSRPPVHFCPHAITGFIPLYKNKMILLPLDLPFMLNISRKKSAQASKH